MITISYQIKMNEKQFRDLFETRPLFTLKQVSSILGKNYSRTYLDRLIKKDIIIRIGQGIYSFHRDPIVYASHIRYPSYISLISAMQIRGLTTQLPKILEVVSNSSGAYLGVDLVRSKYLWGYEKMNYSGFEVFVAGKEKIAIDGIVLERLSMDDIADVLKECDKAKLEEEAMELDISDMMRVGYVSSLQGIELMDLHQKVKKDRNYVRSVFYTGENDWKVRP